MEKFRQFMALLLAALLLGTLSIATVLIWVLHWRRGLAWDSGLLEFNWHPVLSTIGFIVINGFALIIYRLPWTWNLSKPLMKNIHAGLNIATFILMIISLVAVFDFHNSKKIPNMYSLHSWIGLAAVIMYALQIGLGLCIFLLPFTPMYIKAFYMSIHVFAGLFIFGMAIVAAETGITEKLIFTLRSGSNVTLPYSQSPPEAIFVNALGILILVFGGYIFWIATRSEWKRPPEQVKDNTSIEEGSTLNKTNISAEISMDSVLESTPRSRQINLEDVGQRATF
ncbi:plasma membrane ascorbate-dependent reductase CYBRD1 [Pristis pectinata]|uniref:plasma membrane ascorbate-dependent reductase CYBRD1 n=1 Tax=Pristis pectinata TaxID=685728 RepID=UPI00223E3202|nr:plasma membrane ascorbate-dependent reductase CYBRD1 [Pristis pectinata]